MQIYQLTSLLLIGTKLGIAARKLQDAYDYSSETAGWGSSPAEQNGDGETQDDYDYSQETIGWGSNPEDDKGDGETPDDHDYSNETADWKCFTDYSGGKLPRVPCEIEYLFKKRFDMCMEQDNGYDFLPTMNPYCCRMFKRKDEKVVAFEDFCASSHDFARWLEPCEMDMTDI